MRFWSAKGESVRRTASPVELRLTHSEIVVGGSLLLIVTAFGLWLQLRTYPNHDVAWVLWGAREMLHGAKFGRDIIEPNPPLAWFLSMPTTALADWLDVPLDQPFRIAVALAGAASAASLAWLLPRERTGPSIAALCVMASVALVVLPGREFAQREHLLLITILPYLALCARWMAGGPVAHARGRFILGVVVGLGVALKPYFLAVPVMTELALFLLSARRPALLRAEILGIASVCAIYGGWILIAERTYLLQSVPLASEIYWSFDRPIGAILRPLLFQLVVAAPFAGMALLKRDAFGIVIAFAWLGFATSYLIQQKGYGYHLLPVVVATLFLIVCLLTNPRVSRTMQIATSASVLLFAWSCFGPLWNWWVVNGPSGQRSVEIARILASIDRNANGRFLVVAVHPFPSFPTALYTPARYTSRTNSQWFLPAVVEIRRNGASGHDAVSIERHAREFILHDLASKPNLVLIDTNSARHTLGVATFDFLSFYLEDPRFRAIWKSYREIDRIGEYRQFVLTQQPGGSTRAGAVR